MVQRNPHFFLFYMCTIKRFCEFINKLIDIFQLIIVSVILLVAMNCLVLIREINSNDNRYNEYDYDPAANKYKYIFAWLLFKIQQQLENILYKSLFGATIFLNFG